MAELTSVVSGPYVELDGTPPRASRFTVRKVVLAAGTAFTIVATIVAVVMSQSDHNGHSHEILRTPCTGCECFGGTEQGWTPRSNLDTKGVHKWVPSPTGAPHIAPAPHTPQCKSNSPYVDPSTLPANFDARKQWPGWMVPVQNEGESCGSAWSISIPTAASDRLAIATNGAVVDFLSPEYMLKCNPKQPPCDHHGDMFAAWESLTSAPGVPTSTCLPWNVSPQGLAGGCPTECANGDGIASRYHGKKYEFITGEGAMMQSIMNEGPLTTVLTVHMPALQCYSSGIYNNTGYPIDDFHVAVIIGWGQDADGSNPYWLIQNTFGTYWGEEGYFKLIRGQDMCAVEYGAIGYCSIAGDMTQ